MINDDVNFDELVRELKFYNRHLLEELESVERILDDGTIDKETLELKEGVK